MLPDTGERYLSTPLFEEIEEYMTDEELALSLSTPNHRFDKAPDIPSVREDEVAASDAARAFVKTALESSDRPVVMFALEWCEFCWAVRKLFRRCGIEYVSVDIDSAENQIENWGGKVRAALAEVSGTVSIPQVFVGGELIGGATDTFKAFEAGKLQELLNAHQVEFEDRVGDQLYTLLPNWLKS